MNDSNLISLNGKPTKSYSCRDANWYLKNPAEAQPGKTCTIENLECRILWNGKGEPDQLMISFNQENKDRLIAAYSKRDIKKLVIKECDL